MTEQGDILQKLKKPLSIERKINYNNSSVIGGFDSYILNWLNKLTKVVDDDQIMNVVNKLNSLFEDYSEVRIPIRKKKLAESRELFTRLATLIEDNETNKEELPQLWQESIRYIKGVGKKRAGQLAHLGVQTVRDMLFYFPRDYRDWSTNCQIRELTPGNQVTVEGKVINIEEIRPRQGLTITKIVIGDGTGSLTGVWFNQPYIKNNFNRGIPVAFSGKVKKEYGELQMSNPNYELINNNDNLYVGRVLPIYSTTQGLSQNMLRKIVKSLIDEYLDEFPEFLETELREKYNLLGIKEALKMIHFPDKIEDVEEARKRLVFDELFILQLGMALRRIDLITEEDGIVHNSGDGIINNYLTDLPFELTSAQAKVWAEIKEDMESKKEMNRLIQGDVGSGKTVIATLALLKAVSSGYQGAMMAPTEILAEQHYLSLKESLSRYGVEVGLLVGSLTAKEKEAVLDELETGNLDIVIGTHALIQEGINFDNLGLVITDEQHRFGVRQRATFKEKGENPDVLVMTATPIPRTLALTLYGDLELSVIDELPPGRKPVVTEWRTKKAYSKIFSFIRQELEAGRQAYVVCPLVEESEKLDVSSAVEMSDKLINDIFPGFNVGLLHGQLKADEKEEVMGKFRDQEINILVATTVIEVGVNVPNSTLMLIVDAERFGLAQLHQLRGRVGRGQHQSYCILIADPSTETGEERMKIMTQSTDGFVIAEEDLKLRGPGEFFGTRQHGLPDLEIANLLRDSHILEIARKEAFNLVDIDPNFIKPENKLLKDLIEIKFGDNFDLIDVS
ncbi:ATP-dependent DNA helicase RecG [Selenihalanaerobacter shriftii]|nr:ATP-dependent DNA helicase RecG [Selenihalanaerobacter shriftii]